MGLGGEKGEQSVIMDRIVRNHGNPMLLGLPFNCFWGISIVQGFGLGNSIVDFNDSIFPCFLVYLLNDS